MGLLLVFAMVSAATSGQDQDPAVHQAALDQLQAKIQAIQTQMRAATGRRNQVQRDLRQSEQQIGQVSQRLRLLQQQSEAQQARLVQLQTQVRTQQGTLTQQRSALAQQAQAAYRMGHQERLKLLLNQQDPGQFSRMLMYYGYVNQARMTQMQALEAQLARLADTRRALDAQQRQLQTVRTGQERARQRLQVAQQVRQAALRKLDAKLHNQGKKLQDLQANAQQLQRLLQQLQQALAEQALQPQQAFAQRRGTLPWPTPGRVAHTFGSQKVGDVRWDGVLIRAQAGQAVVASYAGRVVFADWLRGFGLLLIIDHGAGYLSLYGHNQGLLKNVGEQVVEGEPIALVGDSGGQRSAGLYFAIRYQGQAVDPDLWCRRRVGHQVS